MISQREALKLQRAVRDALPIVRDYARDNPRWTRLMDCAVQDPNGAHAWLDEFDPERECRDAAEMTGMDAGVPTG